MKRRTIGLLSVLSIGILTLSAFAAPLYWLCVNIVPGDVRRATLCKAPVPNVCQSHAGWLWFEPYYNAQNYIEYTYKDCARSYAAIDCYEEAGGQVICLTWDCYQSFHPLWAICNPGTMIGVDSRTISECLNGP